ncbi:MAG: hypothetical protein H0V66_04190 [Bdellovibrionales bacterium]|nr:hypothetical protein [Bdellovibrionales bacterium]
MRISFFLLGFFAIFFFVKRAELLDTGQELFFPKELYQKITNFSQFQIGKWNNIILKDEAQALKLCRELRDNHRELISKIMCEPQLSEFSPVVQSWLSDQFANFPAPTPNEFVSSAQMEVAKLSLLMGPESQNILALMQMDPLNHKDFLWSKLQGLMNEKFHWKNGLLTHKEDGTIIIPFQFTFKPDEIKKTKEFEKILTSYQASLVGVHEGHLSNREAIENDLSSIGLISALMIILFLGVVSFLKMFKLIKLILPTALGICVSFFITWLVFGKVHGITLSFGTGIIGLAIDYGFHYVFSKDKKLAGKSNFYALLTTLAVFVIFFFSSIPLIRQMMFFSILGLVCSYIFSRWLLVDDHISVDFDFTLRKNKWHALPILAAIVGIFHLIFFKVDTSITRFNFTPPHIKEAQGWFFSQVKTEKVFFKTYQPEDLLQIEADAQMGKSSAIRSENVFSYVPSLAKQKENLQSWTNFNQKRVKLSEVEQKVFAPFLAQLKQVAPDQVLDLRHPPEYLGHLATGEMVANLWFTKGPEQEKFLQENVKGVESLVDIFINFTKLLTREIALFMPITLIAIWGLLYLKYKSLKQSLICLIPFLFSLGLYGLFHRYFHFPLSFMSLLGLFLIYGLSVDYGIFSTDYFTNTEQSLEHESSLNLGLLVNWISGLIGFIPLLWCQHPILSDLGLVLIVGMLGIFYATFYIVPALFLLRSKA